MRMGWPQPIPLLLGGHRSPEHHTKAMRCVDHCIHMSAIGTTCHKAGGTGGIWLHLHLSALPAGSQSASLCHTGPPASEA